MRGHVGITTERYAEVSITFTREEFEALLGLVWRGKDSLDVMGFAEQERHRRLMHSLDAARRLIIASDMGTVSHQEIHERQTGISSALQTGGQS